MLKKTISINSKKIGHDFETQGWTSIAIEPKNKNIFKNFLAHSHDFFNQPVEQKSGLVNPAGLVVPGYMVYPGGRDGYFNDTTQMYHATMFDQTHAGKDNLKSFTRYGCVWPNDEKFVRAVKNLRDYFYQLSLETLTAVEEFYGIDSGELTELVVDGWSMQRTMKYEAANDESRLGSLTVGEHRDTSLLTLTFAGSQPGLEIKNFEGDWMSVDPEVDEVIVGVGGMLEQITNGNFKNMFHRVKYVPQTIEHPRISTPFFCWPKPEAVLTPHPKVMQRYQQTARYPTQLAIKHLEQNLMVPFSFEEDQEYFKNYKYSYKKAA